MTDVGKWLKEADPLAREPGLSEAEAQTIRQAAMAACRAHSARAATWQSFVVATAVVAAMAGAVVVDRWRIVQDPSRARGGDVALPATSAGASDAPRQQLQFLTPGGTRVIWVFDSRFKQ
jgi:hypothetical protein